MIATKIAKSDGQKSYQNPMRYIKRVLRDVLLLVFVVGAVNWGQTFHYKGKDIPSEAFSSSWPTLNQSTMTLADPQKLSLVYIFAPWCGVCRGSANNLNSLKNQGVNIVSAALSYDKDGDVEAFVHDTKLDIPVVYGGGALEAKLNVQVFPTYLLIDSKGKVMSGWSGYTTTLGLWVRIKSVLFFTSHLRA